MFYWPMTVVVCNVKKKKKKNSMMYALCASGLQKFLCSMYTFFHEFSQFSYNYGGGGGGVGEDFGIILAVLYFQLEMSH